MKKLIFAVLTLSLITSTAIQAQSFKWGVRAGLGSKNVSPNDLTIVNKEDLDQFKLALKDAKYGLQVGAFMRFQGKKHFFIQPEIQINTTKSEYEIEDLTNEGVKDLVKESYHNISVPLNMGLKYGPLRLQGGAISTFHIGGASDLKDIEGYEQNFKTTLGWQAGLGLDIWKIALDLRYEGDLSQYANHMEFFGEDVAFGERAKQMKFTVGWTF